MNALKENLRIAAVLAVTTAVSALLLTAADAVSRDLIAANALARTQKGIAALVPQASDVTQKGDVYELRDASKKLLGYAFLCTGHGYQSELKVLAAVDASFATIMGIEVLEAAETPGLGTRVAEGWFKKQFAGKRADGSITYTKAQPSGDAQIQAISGATISSRSVVDLVNAAMVARKAEVKG